MRCFDRRLPRFPTDREPLLLHLVDQRVERPLEDQGQVSVGNSVSEQVLCLSQLVAKCAACGELDPECLLGKRRDGGPMVFSRRRPLGRWMESEESHSRPSPAWHVKEQGTPTSEGSRLTKDREVNTVEPDVVGHGGPRLLVIDDNPHDRQCIPVALNHPGLEILAGEDAEQSAGEEPEQPEPQAGEAGAAKPE